jgi:glycosyltransferase 2 family protein
VRRWVRGVLLVGSIGLALHLVLPQIPGLEKSLRLVAGTSHLLVGAAFLAELVSELCYAELLGRSVGVIFAGDSSPRSWRPGRWFMLRLTVTGYGAAHVFPGGGAAATAVSYDALRRKGYDPESVGLALAAVSVLVYGALGMLFSGSLLYMLVERDLGPVSMAASIFILALTVSGALGVYIAYRRPRWPRTWRREERALSNACSEARGCGEGQRRGLSGSSHGSGKCFRQPAGS